MLYELIQHRRGKVTSMMVDELPKVLAHMKKLRNSQRKGIKGDKVIYQVLQVFDDREKFKRKPHNYNPGGVPARPERIR